MTIAVIIGDYCSEIMPWWWCTLFYSPTVLAVALVGVSVTVLAVAAANLSRTARAHEQRLDGDRDRRRYGAH